MNSDFPRFPLNSSKTKTAAPKKRGASVQSLAEDIQGLSLSKEEAMERCDLKESETRVNRGALFNNISSVVL
jgi:hypothetical protein